MSIKALLTLLALILWLFIGSWWYASTCCGGAEQGAALATQNTTADTKPTTLETPKPAAAATLLIEDGTRFRTTANDNLRFGVEKLDFDKPLSAELTKSFGDLAAYLKANPKRTLTLTGLYNSSEKNTSLLSTMGLARATNMKKYLESLGVNGQQIMLADKLDNGFAFQNNIAHGGLGYSFADKAEEKAAQPAAPNNNDAARLVQIEKDLKAKPIVLYFETAQSSVNVTDSERQRFADLIYYLTQKGDKKALVVGHTDNVGAADMNMKYGQERAEFAKSYLIQNGLKNTQIETASKGETQPAVSNNTPQNRAKNRRAEVTVK